MSVKIPVLVYHALMDAEDPGAHFVHVLKEEFSRQMQWLYEQGYKTLSLDELYEAITGKHEIPDKAVVLTFDDGYSSLFTHATPVLQKYGFKAVLFLTTGAVGCDSYKCLPNCELYPADDRPLNWDELLQMKASCWDIQAHGHRHFAHADLSPTELEQEIMDCNKSIKAHLGHIPRYYCYPYGSYTVGTLRGITKLNMKAAFSVQPGFASRKSDIRRIFRIGVDIGDDISSFQLKVESGYVSRKEKLEWTVRNFIYGSAYLRDLILKGKKFWHRICIMPVVSDLSIMSDIYSCI